MLSTFKMFKVEKDEKKSCDQDNLEWITNLRRKQNFIDARAHQLIRSVRNYLLFFTKI